MKVNQKLAALLASTALMFVGLGENQAQSRPLSPNFDRSENQLVGQGGNLLLAEDSEEKSEQDTEQQKPVYTFRLMNKTDKDITVVAAADAEGGESMGTFDLENGKIEAGDTATLVWDESTNNTGCNWAITVGFDDGSVAEPEIVDFCEENVSLEVK